MSEPGTETHKRRLAFDPTINLGHVLTFVGFIATGLVAYSNLDKRVTMVEQVTSMAQDRQREKDMALKESVLDLRADVKDMQAIMRDVQRTVDSAALPKHPPSP